MLFFRGGKADKREKEKTKIHFSELKEQFENLVAKELNQFEEAAREYFDEILAAKADLKRSIASLEEATLMNENIPVKEKHFMEGNRAAYVKLLNMFTRDLKEPEEISVEKIEEFLEDYGLASKDFIKSSAKPAHITNNFFGDELSRIADNLRTIEDAVKNLAELIAGEDVRHLSSARKGVRQLFEEVRKREELLEEIEKEEKGYEDVKSEKAVFEHKILAIKKHLSFLQLNELNARIKNIDDEAKIISADFINNFLQIEKALKKCPKEDDATEKLIAEYLEDPVSAVLNDQDLKIMDIIAKIGEALKNNQIEMDEKKKERILSKISSIDRMTFTNFIVKYNDLQLKKSDASRMLKQNNSQREIEDLQYRLDHAAEKQKKSIEKIKKLDSQIEGLKIEETKESIEKSMEALGAPITIELFESTEEPEEQDGS